MGIKQKKIKEKKSPTKKSAFFKPPNSQYFFAKISGIGPGLKLKTRFVWQNQGTLQQDGFFNVEG